VLYRPSHHNAQRPPRPAARRLESRIPCITHGLGQKLPIAGDIGGVAVARGRHYWSYAAVLVEERDHETGAMATHEEASQPRCHCSVLRIESLAVENDTDPAITRRPIIHIYIHERGKQRSKSKRSRSYVYHSNTCILLYSPTCVGDSSLVSNICVVLPLA
jgi:hypothetical protein